MFLSVMRVGFGNQDVMAVNHVRGAWKMKSTAFMDSSSLICERPSEPNIKLLEITDVGSRNQGKSDKILETVLRMDGLLRSIHENLVCCLVLS